MGSGLLRPSLPLLTVGMTGRSRGVQSLPSPSQPPHPPNPVALAAPLSAWRSDGLGLGCISCQAGDGGIRLCLARFRSSPVSAPLWGP